MHPGRTGYAIVADAFIVAINDPPGYAIRAVDVAAVWAGKPARTLCVAGP